MSFVADDRPNVKKSRSGHPARCASWRTSQELGTRDSDFPLRLVLSPSRGIYGGKLAVGFFLTYWQTEELSILNLVCNLLIGNSTANCIDRYWEAGGDGKSERWIDGREEADTHNEGPMQSPLPWVSPRIKPLYLTLGLHWVDDILGNRIYIRRQWLSR